VARIAGRPKRPGGEGKSVRIKPDLASKAKIVALRRGIALSEYLSDLLRTPITRDYRKVIQQEIEAESEGDEG
jgi:hypothetical protein